MFAEGPKVIGLGVDMVDIERFRRVLARRAKVADRLFTEAELSFVAGRSDPVPGLAARFAAKEATMKALGTGVGGVRFCDIEVLSAPSGAPRLRVRGLAEEKARTLGVVSWHVSLTHSESLAAAVVVAD